MNWKGFWEKWSNWELWPFALRYLLISPVWAWYCIRSGSLWFFSSSNPTITFGGFEGEGKKEMYELLPLHTYPKTIYIQPDDLFSSARHRITENGFSYPFIVKPDVGMKGLLFRKIDNEAALEKYHRLIPMEYIVQELVEYPLEVSVFYYRYPDHKKGVITGFIQKELMDIVGDGRSTIWELIVGHEKAKHRLEEMRIKHLDSLDKVLPPGDRYILTHAANLNRGARFTNLKHLIDDDLLNVFDVLSHPTQFYYGRYDIKCRSVEDLKKGEHFSILEFNGSGAEPNHVYNAGYSLIEANLEFIKHWKVLFEISRYNKEHGVPYWSFKRGWEFLKQAKRHLRILEQYDREILV
jgi:hypothetical protein